MLATLDLHAVRRFTEDLSERLRRCDHGEGTACSTPDDSINFYVQLGRELREGINLWARAVFAGRAEFDAQVETLFQIEARSFLQRAKQVAARGRAMDGQCFELRGLAPLHYHIADFDYLLSQWTSPRLAVGPAPREDIPPEAARQILDRLAGLPPLPNDWCPADPVLREQYRKHRPE